MTWPELLELICKGVTAVAAFIGGLAAWRGVSTWRKQLVGQDEYNLAKRLRKNAIELERSIRRIRLPNNLQELTWPEFDRIGDEMDLALLEAEVQWGDLLAKEKAVLVACTNELRLQRERLASLSDSRDDPGSMKILQEANAILWTIGIDQKDEFACKVQAAVEALTRKLLPHLKR